MAIQNLKTCSGLFANAVFVLLLAAIASVNGQRSILSDPGISLASIESLPETKPLGFTYEPTSPNFYKLINNITYYEFNGTYFEELNGTFVPAIESTVNGTFTLLPATSIEAAGTDGYDYGQVLGLSLLFYEAQRSGVLPLTNRVAWRGNSAVGDVSPGGTDVSGGWYDAGDHLKLNFPAAFAAGNLAWGFIEFQQGFINSGNQDYMLDNLRWIADYFVKCHYAPEVFTGQVGDTNTDHALWERAEDMSESRPSADITPTAPGSDLLGQVSGLLAACSIIFNETDPAYSEMLLSHAEEIWSFGTQYEGKYSDSIADAFPYPSTSYLDDLAWGSVWMYKATMDDQYLQAAEMYVDRNTNEEGGGGYQAYNWDTSAWGAYLLLAQIQGSDSPYPTKIQGFLEAWVMGSQSVEYTPSGLAYLSPWGSLRHTSNAALIAASYSNLIASSDSLTSSRYSCWARSQIRYMLGDSGRSFVVGFGNNPPTHIHHRGASCPIENGAGSGNPSCDYTNYALQTPNPNILYGALVGGPGDDDSYADLRSDYQKNEVAVDYNAGFTGAVAFLAESMDTIGDCVARGDVVHQIYPATNNQY